MTASTHIVATSLVQSNMKIVIVARQNGKRRLSACPHLDFVIVFNRGSHGVAAKVGANMDSDGKASFEIGPVRTCKVLEILVSDHHAAIAHFKEKNVRQEKDEATIHQQNLQHLKIWRTALSVYPGW